MTPAEAIARYRALPSSERKSPGEILLAQVKSYNELQGDLQGVDCPKCKNKGFIAVANTERQTMETRICECQTKRTSIQRMEKSGLSQVLKKCTLEDYRAGLPYQKTVKQKALAYIGDKSGKWFFIGGQSGSGKTHICTAICGELLKSGHEVVYMQWVRDSGFLKSLKNDEAYQPTLAKYLKAEVLYIDDLFKPRFTEPPTAADVGLLFEILNYRYNGGLKTIFSSEHTINELIDIDEACGGRIKEMCGENVLTIHKDAGKNMRLDMAGGINNFKPRERDFDAIIKAEEERRDKKTEEEKEGVQECKY